MAFEHCNSKTIRSEKISGKKYYFVYVNYRHGQVSEVRHSDKLVFFYSWLSIDFVLITAYSCYVVQQFFGV